MKNISCIILRFSDLVVKMGGKDKMSEKKSCINS